MPRHISSSAEAGFTLIELSIALVVIGLIIGGVITKGTSLIEATRLNKVLTQVGEIKHAVLLFQEQFNALPGAYGKATDNIKDTLINGQSNTTITGDGLDPGSEAGQFWAHLSAANLISDVGSVTGSEINFGSGAPSAKIGGGFTVKSDPSDTMPGLWLVLGRWGVADALTSHAVGSKIRQWYSNNGSRSCPGRQMFDRTKNV